MYYVYWHPKFSPFIRERLGITPTFSCTINPVLTMSDSLIDIVDRLVTIEDYPELLI